MTGDDAITRGCGACCGGNGGGGTGDDAHCTGGGGDDDDDGGNGNDVTLVGDCSGDSSGANDDDTDDGVAVALSANEPVLPDDVVVPSSMVMNFVSFCAVTGESNHLSTFSTACGFCFCSFLLIFEHCNKRNHESGIPVNSPVTESKPT